MSNLCKWFGNMFNRHHHNHRHHEHNGDNCEPVANHIVLAFSFQSFTVSGEFLMAQNIVPGGKTTATVVGYYVDATSGATVQTSNLPAAPVWTVTAGFTLTPSADGLSTLVDVADTTTSSTGTLTVTSGTLTITADVSFTAAVTPPPAPVATSLGIVFTTAA